MTTAIAKQTNALKVISEVAKALDKAETVYDVKKLADQLLGVEFFLKAEKAHLDDQNRCTELRLRARRKAGEMLRQQENRGGDRKSKKPKSQPVTLKSMGIDKMESSRLQKEAAVPKPVFERYVKETKKAGEELTAAGVRRQVVEPIQKRAIKEKREDVYVGEKSVDEVARNQVTVRWHKNFHDLWMNLNSIRDLGGIEAIIKKMSPKYMSQVADDLDKIITTLQGWAKAIRKASK